MSGASRNFPDRLDLSQVRVWPLERRASLSTLDQILVSPESEPGTLPGEVQALVEAGAERIRTARALGRSVMLIYGAHLIKNGGMGIMNQLIREGWVTHLATNGAGTIHDWELSYLGRTEESVRTNVAQGCFGTWDETGRNIHLALMAGALRGDGYGRSLGQFIHEEGTDLPSRRELELAIQREPAHALAPARADMLQAMVLGDLPEGRLSVPHPWKAHSVLAEAFRSNVPVTVHPGIGYDIFSTHPLFNGAVIGRAGGWDFALFSRAVEGLDEGVVMSIGSAIMGPQVFEKSLSCVNNLRLGAHREPVRGHSIFVVDVQDGGGWDWSQGEPPKDNPAYYLRFCKSFARMGGAMHYVQADNVTFLHHLSRKLRL